MTIEKEKAEELIEKMHACGRYGFEIEDARKCASIAVAELLENLSVIESINSSYQGRITLEFYKKVQIEIEKL